MSCSEMQSRGVMPERRGPRRAIGGVALGVLFMTSAACGARQVPSDLGAPWGATVQDITSNPSAVEGRIVTVSGEVNRVFGPRWFSIGGEGYGGGEELLVVGPSAVPSILNNLADSGKVSNDLVQVTGRVRVFEEDAIEREINADLDGDLFDIYDGKAVVVMHDLDITPRVDVVPAVAVPVPVPVGPITDVLVIVDAPERSSLVGRSVALFDVKVVDVVSPRAFWVGPGNEKRLLVVLDSTAARTHAGHTAMRAGQTVSIAGVIKAMPTNLDEVRAPWGLTGDTTMVSRERTYLSVNDLVVTDS